MAKKQHIDGRKNKQNLKKILGKDNIPEKKREVGNAIVDDTENVKGKEEDKPLIRHVEPKVGDKARAQNDLSANGKNAMDEKEKNLVMVEISERWHSMEEEKDLCDVLNLALQVLYGKDAKKLPVGWIKHLARKSPYRSFKIPKKKKGKFRKIDAPCRELRNVQRVLNLVFQLIYTPHEAAMGFVPKRSVVTNAQVHLGQRFVYNIDLKDFFPSITSGRLYKRLLVKPFCINEKVASLISDLCCYKDDDGKKVLPQGAPTSPTITNFICERLDLKLTKLAKSYGLKYTRYADDITFSGMSNVFSPDGKFCTSLFNIVENEESFKINKDKSRLCHRGMRQEVTGLTVNNKTNVSRKYIKQLRVLIHNWEVKGYDEAQAIFAEHYKETNTRHLLSKGEHHIENIISGKLMYLKMVKGEKDSTYKALYMRFEKLIETQFGGKKPTPTISGDNENVEILKELTNLANLIETNTMEKNE